MKRVKRVKFSDDTKIYSGGTERCNCCKCRLIPPAVKYTCGTCTEVICINCLVHEELCTDCYFDLCDNEREKR